MIAIIGLVVAVLAPAFFAEDIIYSIAAFGAATIAIMLLNPMPTVSESVLVVATSIVLYAGAVYLTKRAVDYLLKDIFARY